MPSALCPGGPGAVGAAPALQTGRPAFDQAAVTPSSHLSVLCGRFLCCKKREVVQATPVCLMEGTWPMDRASETKVLHKQLL